ncbi:uncharacterized protein K460DRAFT_413506 [Cucurbitaria berberidis CBS 394.84]|uniref:Arrestin-like N-terminal domain-containing protein n=1 Tax=Cucurbitaria berberidis CBS 394.84 TaxID=1168544 RepID=A0A9P4GT20_9PLEO|nr:uncharacterized protein K460DRAFT_413506 [Cucurbitaria berberidis CBS 394.84]KAF1852028.1 hypothetical protein K460DRAFT_413506 [Cucurbitaria berberidis CBS 394.84]
MDVSIKLDHPKATFSNGETIFGSIVVYFPTTSTVSKITARLIGESELTMPETSGMLNWKQQEKHRFVNESQVVVPSRYVLEESNQDHLKLPFGYHNFYFELKVPELPESCCCSPNSPVSPLKNVEQRSRSSIPQDLPPSMKGLVNGSEVSYRIEVAVTTTRNIFKSTVKKSVPVSVWPIDTQPRSITNMSPNTFPCVKRVKASVMGPSTRTQNESQDTHLISTVDEPAHVLVSASFLPKYNLTRDRNIAMRLTVEKLNSFPHDLYLQSFQMLLVGYTDITTGTTTNSPVSCWTIQSLSNLNTKIFSAVQNGETERIADLRLWDGKRLPKDVLPSFDACNLARRYELEILMGFQCRDPTTDEGGRVLFVQLRTPVRVSSGILPGRQLDDLDEDLLGDDVPLALQMNSLSMHDGFGQQSPPQYEPSRLGFTDASLPPEPPTYDEAMMISMNERLREGKEVVSGGW